MKGSAVSRLASLRRAGNSMMEPKSGGVFGAVISEEGAGESAARLAK